MKRQQAREYVFDMIYEAGFKNWENIDEMLETALAEYIDINENDIQFSYITNSIKGVSESLSKIDDLIKPYLKNWTFERLPRVTTAILRLAVYEMRFNEEIPVNVAINEAVELAKKYDDEKSPAFINGVLSSIDKEIK